ncbi:MAG: Amuc_1099 family pilus-like system protein, partial [Akkermansia sp.]|nr:Amuc_1099 family pilus-like system protein [Akkermansia sp.]
MAEQSNPGLKAIITGVVLGVASAALGGYTMYSGTVSEPETGISGIKSDGSLTAQAEKVKETMKRDFSIVDTAPAGATINGQPRMAPLFFSTELWQITRDDAKEVTVVDIYDPAAPSVHGEIPNSWFIANNIADALGRSDGRILDSDEDGFTNAEEFAANTCPSAASSYPDLVSASGSIPKLEVVKVSTARAIIATDNMFAMSSQKPTSVNIRIYAKRADVLPVHKVTVKPGESFGLNKDDKSGRFTLVRFDTREYPDYGGNMNKENVIVVRDNETASPEKEFVIRAGKTPAGHADEKDEKIVKGRKITDTTVTLRVTAGSAAGKPEGQIRVQLNGSFLIPGGKADGSE